MTKGVRDFVNEKFVTGLVAFQAGEKTGTEFRKGVMDAAQAAFGITLASASTHYNFALKEMRKADPQSVKGLGREEGKKGGRKPLTTVTVVKVKTGEIVATGISKEKASLMITVANSTKGKAKLKLQDELVAEVAPAVEAAPVAEAVPA
jgi:hypothetical protein